MTVKIVIQGGNISIRWCQKVPVLAVKENTRLPYLNLVVILFELSPLERTHNSEHIGSLFSEGNQFWGIMRSHRELGQTSPEGVE